MMSVDHTVYKKKTSKKRGKSYKKPALPLNTDDHNEEAILPLSPVLCNHHYPRLELLKPEDHGLYWVSPQCHGCENKPKRRRNRKQNTDVGAIQTVRCAQSQHNRHNLASAKPKLRDRTLTAKEKFIYTRSKSLHTPKAATVLAPDTPKNEQGLTLKEKLLRKSTRLQLLACKTSES